MKNNTGLNDIKNKINTDFYDAVLFDMDGTLVDSMWMWGDIDKEYLAGFNIDCPSDLERKISGMCMTEVADYFQKRFKIDDPPEKMMKDWIDMSFQKYRDEVFLKPGVKEFLSFLKDRGMKLGIGTSNDHKNAEACLKNNGVFEYFECIGTSQDVKRGKPFPDIFLYTAKQLGARPERCLCFDDLTEGIMAANSAGMDSVAVFDQNSEYDTERKKEAADGFIMSFEEMLPIFK